ncbi:hypothetical protein HAX54_006155, partial [Datura stramonium]|nr:hypothetical protein [Datura stramonium]
TMESQADKGKEVVVTGKGIKRPRMGTKWSKSSTAKASLTRMFRAKTVEEHGLKWSNALKES